MPGFDSYGGLDCCDELSIMKQPFPKPLLIVLIVNPLRAHTVTFKLLWAQALRTLKQSTMHLREARTPDYVLLCTSF